MTDHPQVLPKFHGAQDGSGCDNPDCGASNRHIRVLSEFEMERMYPRKDSLPQWPFPPQATHACEKCGYCYQGVAGQASLPATDGDERPDVDIEAYDWDPDMVWQSTVRESIEALISGRPDDAEMSEVAEAVSRYIPGAGADDAERVAADMDVDFTIRGLHEFM